MSRIRRNYPYSINDSILRKGSPPPRAPRKILRKLLVLILAGGGIFLLFKLISAESLVAHLPFPKELEAVRFLHNGKEVILLPDSQGIVNPRDTLQFVEVKTDGWVSWGTRLNAADVDLDRLKAGPVIIRDLMPHETFEVPQNLDLWVSLWNRPIGKVSFLVQLDSRDWVQKANTVEDDEKRLAYLENALRENPANTLLKTQLAGVYFERQRYDEAVKLYREVNETGQSATILEKLLQVHQAQRKTGEALAVYLELLSMTEDAAHFKGLLSYLNRIRSTADSLRFLETHRDRIPGTFHNSLHLHLADLAGQNRNWSKAAQYYDLAVRGGVTDADVLYNLAVSHQQAGDVNRAFAAMERYVKARPNDSKSLMQLAALAEKKGDTAKAKEVYERLVRNNPQNRDALLRLIAVLEKSGDKKGLESAYEKLAQQQPDNKTVLNNLAVLYYQGGSWDKAARSFERLAKLDPGDARTHTYLLDIYRKQKNQKGELETLKTLARLETRNTAYHEAIFAHYDEKKDYKSMRSYFQGVAKERPNSVQVRNYLLYAALKQGDKNAAVKELEALARLQPKEKKHLRQAADLYESMGNWAEASRKYEQLIKLDPKDNGAQDAYLRLQLKAIRSKEAKPS